jgi:DNA-binding MarR family transcriptional regulator
VYDLTVVALDRSNLARLLGKQRPFASPRQEAYLNLMRTQAIASAPFDRLFKSHGISQPLYNILRILRGHLDRDEAAGRVHIGIPVLRIGQEMITREPDLTRLVNRLEKAGLASRNRGSEDRRVVFVRLTEAGVTLLDRIQAQTESLHESQFRGLSDDELRTLNDLLFRAAITIADTG